MEFSRQHPNERTCINYLHLFAVDEMNKHLHTLNNPHGHQIVHVKWTVSDPLQVLNETSGSHFVTTNLVQHDRSRVESSAQTQITAQCMCCEIVWVQGCSLVKMTSHATGV